MIPSFQVWQVKQIRELIPDVGFNVQMQSLTGAGFAFFKQLALFSKHLLSF